MSKLALWITSLASSAMKSMKSLTIAANFGLSRRKSSPRPWTSNASLGIDRSGLI